MTKQDYLLAVIDAMPDREMGRGIKAMIENNQLEEKTIDKLAIAFKKMVDGISDIIKKYHVMKAIETFEQQKQAQAQQDQADLERLDGLLNTF
jgi:phage-related minor tail protein